MTNKIKIYKEDKYYIATDLSTGVTSKGEDKTTAINNLQEALSLYHDWDPDFTKLTDNEKERLELAEKEIAKNDFVDHSSINWD